MSFALDVVVVGGCGHVGLPLGLALADRALRTVAFDIDATAVAMVNAGGMPIVEPAADELVRRLVGDGTFSATTDPSVVSDAEVLIIVIGTPVDEHLNPDPAVVDRTIRELGPHLRDGQLLVLRSTVYPGVTRLVQRTMDELGLDIDVACCPERIAEGRAFVELYELPQVISGCTQRAADRAATLFATLTDELVFVTPDEAELVKLFTNAWRYLKFAAANQFYMIANDYGIDFERVRSAMTYHYPRAADVPGAGFAAGPCLLKDTMQLAAFNNNNFHLGHSAMMVNEGLPLYVVSRLEARYDLRSLTVGVLGMAFKANSGDGRDSLAYKLRRILRYKAKAVLCTDPHVKGDPSLVDLDDVLAAADLLILAAPHDAYRELRPRQPVVDVWGLFGNGVVV